MAPAGSWESLSAALQAGADAVYFGVESLNMRSLAAKTFTLDDLPEIAGRSREAGVRTYLTVNTVLYDEDLPFMRSILDRAKREGVSAVILSDAAALSYARSIGLEAHLSTQLNISNVEALRFYAQFADVFVPARELRLEQIGAIAEAIRRDGIKGPSGKLVQIEAFCHGALCMAVSGKCHLSTHTRGKSANRGECLQNCRRTYRLVDAERGIEIDVEGQRFLSPKDLKTIGFMDRMVAAGVTVFKIEAAPAAPNTSERRWNAIGRPWTPCSKVAGRTRCAPPGTIASRASSTAASGTGGISARRRSRRRRTTARAPRKRRSTSESASTISPSPGSDTSGLRRGVFAKGTAISSRAPRRAPSSGLRTRCASTKPRRKTPKRARK